MARTIAKDHEAKRRKILKAAARLFAQEGIARASMNNVAQAAGISKANIYHYYTSKDALLFDFLDTYLSDLRGRVCGLDLRAVAPEDRLAAMATEILLAYAGMDHEHKIQAEGLPLLPPAQQKILRGYQREIVARMSELVQHHAPTRFAADPALLRTTVMSVFGMLNWFYMWNAKADEAARRAYAAQVARLTIGGIPAL